MRIKKSCNELFTFEQIIFTASFYKFTRVAQINSFELTDGEFAVNWQTTLAWTLTIYTCKTYFGYLVY